MAGFSTRAAVKRVGSEYATAAGLWYVPLAVPLAMLTVKAILTVPPAGISIESQFNDVFPAAGFVASPASVAAVVVPVRYTPVLAVKVPAEAKVKPVGKRKSEIRTPFAVPPVAAFTT